MNSITTQNVMIIGTSHISKESINTIKKGFDNKPEIVCVELDYLRLHALMTNKKQKISLKIIPQIGLQGFFFALIGGWVQKKLGSIVGIKPGSDMLAAVKLARENNTQLELIDRDIRLTLKRLKKITLKEKMRFIKDLIISPFSKKQKIRINLSKVPKQELINLAMEKLKKDYPTLNRVILDERDSHMAKRIFVLSKKNPEKKILVVVGAGHEAGIRKNLEKMFNSFKYETA